MTPEAVANCFTRPDGRYFFARWGRPMAPVVFGVDDRTLGIVKGAIEATVALAGHNMSETDTELGANLMLFFLEDWEELVQLPNLDQMIPKLSDTVSRLKGQDARQYRLFRFDQNGAIKACFAFVCLDRAQQESPAEEIALDLAVRVMLTWSKNAFANVSVLERDGNGKAVLRAELASLIKAAYDRILPVSASDPAHALRLYARLESKR